MKSSFFYVFLNLTYPLKKQNLFPKILIKQNRQTVVMVVSITI